MAKNLLITGGAGYIGSHMAQVALAAGYNVVALDDLSNSYCNSVPKQTKLVVGDIGDMDLVKKIIAENRIEAVFHFASFIESYESVLNPEKYYHNNVTNTLRLIEAITTSGVNFFIFSSSAAIFGEPDSLPITENHSTNPTTPYGKTKLEIEEALRDVTKSHPNFRYGCLRYFNAAGADFANGLGENRKNESHLIPLLIRFAAGKIDHFTISGNDYATPDGTCIRDYIHVLDLCDAHLQLLHFLLKNSAKEVDGYFNLGSGKGYSVLEIVSCVEEVIGKKLQVEYGKRRSGDVAQLVASSDKAKAQLGWSPKHSDLRTIVSSAWEWEQKRSSL